MNRTRSLDDLPGTITKGPGSFITYRRYLHRDKPMRWLARQHRKGLLLHPDQTQVPIWQRPTFNWWTAACFAIGSLLFMVAAALSLVPNPLTTFQIAALYFAGSVPFTTAGFLQNFQAANATDFSPSAPRRDGKVRLIGWAPHRLGWLSTITQFAGTVAFNINTFDAINPGGGWYQQDLTIWLPDLVGSILFLVSAYIAFMETSHGYWSWTPRDLDWQIVSINLLGCVFFMSAALVSYIPSEQEPAWIADLANIQVAIGAFCFLLGALLMMRESRQISTRDAQQMSRP